MIRVLVFAILLAGCLQLCHATPMPSPIPAENGMVVVSIPVDNMDVQAAVQQAKLFASPGGVVMGDDRIHRIIVKDFPANIERMRAHLGHVDIALPMVAMQVSFNTHYRERNTQIGVTGNAGVVTVNGRRTTGVVTATGTAYDSRSNDSNSGTMSVVTMSGSEGVISVGENIPLPQYTFFQSYAVDRGYLPSNVILQNVSTGFGVVPTVLGGDEIMLKVYPRISYLSPTGNNVIRFMEAATEVRAHSGQSIQIAASSSDSSGVFGRILTSGSFSGGQSGSITVTPTIMPSR